MVLSDRRLFAVTAVLCALLYGGCVATFAPYRITTLPDDFRGTKIYRMEGNTLSGGRGEVQLNIQRFESADDRRVYSLIAYYYGEGWLFIAPGNSLNLIVDGETMRFVGDGSRGRRDVITGRMVRERAWYDVSPAQLRSIASAESVRVRVDGERLYVERTFSDVNRKNFQRFVSEFVDEEK